SGTLNGDVSVGGDLGGVSAKGVNFSPLSVTGTTGTFVDTTGTFTSSGQGTLGHAVLGSADAQINVNGNKYTLHVENATGTADYHVEGNKLVIDDINLTSSGPGATLDVTNSGTPAEIDTLNVSGNLASVSLDGSHIGQFNVSGTNFALTTVTLSKGSYYTFTNADSTSSTDRYINVYLKHGTATVNVIDGQIESILLGAGNNSGLLVEASATALATPDSGTATAKGANHNNDKYLSHEIVAIEKGTAGTQSTNAYVGLIGAAGTQPSSLNQAAIAGTVGSINLPNGNVANVTITGDLNSAMAGSLKNVTVDGNAGAINGGHAINNLTVRNNVDQVVASNISNVQVGNNAGIISAGNSLNKASVHGSAIQISASRMTKVNVSGSVGLATGVAASSGLALGNSFSQADAERILGTSDLSSIANPGANGAGFYGGINAQSGKNIAVGGAISDLTIGRANAATLQLLGQVVDDANVAISAKKVFIKTNGVLTTTPNKA
ncbi:MAG TPA: hypothetical protein VG722_06735, partial [Tepidisphaeraceae bacterium]|nr:hypothetical protein [Tepidisphaeraceae bacterium]